MAGGCTLVAGFRASGARAQEGWVQPIQPRPEAVSCINSQQVTIRYRIAPGSTPPTDVELWYTQDGAVTWSLWTGPKDSKPGTVSFEAWKEGLYGFYVILKNRYGGSAPPPKPGTAPHQWVRVDQTAPRVQMLEACPSERFAENREVLIRWETIDESVADRGVSLYYRLDEGRTFQKIAEMLEPRSAFRWTVPEDVRGIVTLKVAARDRAGNVGSNISQALRIEEGTRGAKPDNAPAVSLHAAGGAAANGSPAARLTPVASPRPSTSPRILVDEGGAAEPGRDLNPRATAREPASAASTTVRIEPPPFAARDAGSVPPPAGIADPPALRPRVSEAAVREAKKRYDLGTWHRLRGETALAMVKYREALEHNPDLADARNDLAGLLFLAGQHRAAEKEFERVLESEPRHRAAMKSLALVQAAQRNYRSAQESLRKLLSIDEDDAEAWLYLGDVTMFMRDSVAAREYWLKAAARKECPESVKERVDKRLAIYRGEQRSLAQAEEP